MRIAVTGGAGFIGSHLTTALVQAGHDVVVVDNLATGKLANLDHIRESVDFRHIDIRDRASLVDAFQGATVVFHEAALGSVPRSIADPATTNDVNINGTLNVLLAAKETGVRRVIYAASSSAYGDTEVLPKVETMRSLPLSPYAVSKAAGEMYMSAFSRSYGLETLSLRYFNVFGPRQDPNSQYAAVIPRFVMAALSGTPATVNGDGEQSRDFTFVENVVHANMLALKATRTGGEVINVACGGRVTLNQLLDAISRELGVSPLRNYGVSRPGDVRHSLADISLAEKVIGYRPIVAFEKGISLTVDWYRVQLAHIQAATISERTDACNVGAKTHA